jgi:DNA-binding MurR/RpiR family transcriptional regulator
MGGAAIAQSRHGADWAIEERLADRQHAFTKAERKVATWLEANVESVAFKTVNAVASASNVSEATIVRFARKLGFDSYTSMQRAAQAALRRQYSLGDKLQQVLEADADGPLERSYRRDLENLRRTYERLDAGDFSAAVRTLSHARRVLVVGLRASAGSALYLAFALQLVRPRVQLVRHDLDDVHEQLLDVGPGDALLVVSVAKPARRTVEVVRGAKERRGMAVVALASSRVSAVAKLADNVLLVSATGTFNSYAAVASVSGALIDAVATSLQASATARLRAIDEINHADEVYFT